MGDRGNIVLIEDSIDKPIFLYTHWDGSELPEILRLGLEKGMDRWDDFPYLSRIIFQTLIAGDKGLTGYGLSVDLCDNEYDLLVVNNDRVIRYPEHTYEQHKFNALTLMPSMTFEEYVSETRNWENACLGQKRLQKTT